MAMMGPLKSEISRYRRRKQHSLDGAVAGMLSYHGTSSSVGMAAVSHVPHAPAHFDLYDPFGPMYDWAQPDYRLQEHYFADLRVPPPSPERIAGPEHAVQMILSDAVQQQIEINRAVESVRDEATNEVSLAPDLWSREPSDNKHPWFDDEQAPREMIDAAFRAAVPDQAGPSRPEFATESGALPAMAAPEPEQLQQGLEAMVEEVMLQQAPPEMKNDFLEQQQMMYEEEMRQLLDPFTMPGFGPG